MKKLPKINTSKLLKAALPYILVGLMATKLGQAYRMASGGDVLDRIFGAFLKIGEAFTNPLPSLHPFDLLVGAACGALLWFIVYQKSKNARKYRRGAEYGTARWGNAKDIEPFIDPDFSQNILLSETERLTLGKIADPEKRNVNLNVLVIGGSGSGKTRYHIKPNLLQMNASYVCSDPKGTVIEEVGRALVRGGYKIKVLNTIDFSCSMHYNPFVYLHSETDILTLVTVIMTNTQGEAKGGDDFWQKAEALLYQALIAYIYYEAPAEERNMNTLLDMLNACECREDDENFKSAVDLLFEQLEQRNPDHFAARQYKKFKMAAGKTLKSILISCGARLAPFDIAAVREMMSYDELELEKLGDEKTALFAVVSDTDPTFNFISAMMYSQMFNVLCDRALKVYHGRLPIHVTCLFDEFANQKIPNWEHLVSVIRSRNISAHIVLQTFSQLKGMYKDNAETVAGCCSTMLFLGGKEESSLKMVSGLLGKETIDTMNESDSRGAQRTYGLNYQKLGKELMSVDELAVMPSSRCIVQVQGVRPFYSKKYDLTKHPQYKYTADAKRQYAKEFRKAKQAEKQGSAFVQKAKDMFGSIGQTVATAVQEHKGGLVMAGAIAMLIIMVFSSLSSCSVMMDGAMSAVLGTSYTSEDPDIIQTEANYTALETALQNELANIERTHPGYDEYRYDVDSIGHNPNELISYLTAKFDAFTPAQVQAELEAMFDRQYSLTTREVVEIRTRTVTSTDPETGETTEDEEEYEYYILYVTLRNKGFGAVALENLDEEQKERYTATLSLKGNKPYLFGSDIYANESTGEDYDIPGEALADPDFAALIAEAEKYLGFPYVWGGSSPSTSFDCSGFVCYVYTHSGVHNLPRTTAQGIYNQCAHIPMSEAKPGDIIFFTGTYNSPGPVSHVGIYVGNNMMIHCGSPIQYARTDSSYWSQHFYAIGRLN